MAGDFWLYCKGADSSLFPLIVSGKVNEAIVHVADFSMVRKSSYHEFYLQFFLSFWLKKFPVFLREACERLLLGTKR